MHHASMHACGLRPRAETKLEIDSTFARILEEDDPEAMSRLFLQDYTKHMFKNGGGATLLLRSDASMHILDSEPGWSMVRIGTWARACAAKFRADQFVLGFHSMIRPVAISNSQEKLHIAISIGGHRDHPRAFTSSTEILLGDMREAKPDDTGNVPLYRTPSGRLMAVVGTNPNHLADMEHVHGIFRSVLPWNPVDPADLMAADAA